LFRGQGVTGGMNRRCRQEKKNGGDFHNSWWGEEKRQRGKGNGANQKAIRKSQERGDFVLSRKKKKAPDKANYFPIILAGTSLSNPAYSKRKVSKQSFGKKRRSARRGRGATKIRGRATKRCIT